MSRQPLMPKATAVWLVDNTSLTFEQIAEFCNLHVLEVKGIADGDVAQGIKGMDPIASGQLTRDEIKRGQEESSYRLKLAEAKVEIPVVETKKGPRYTPVSRRQDRPNAILWLLRSHPELRDSQVMRLVGTTKPTIQSIRERTHWNSPNLQPIDPVTLGLCLQTDLDKEVKRAARRLEREQKEAEKDQVKGGSLLPADETTGEAAVDPAEAAPVAQLIAAADMPAPQSSESPAERPDARAAALAKRSDAPATAVDALTEAESVFAKLKELKLEDDTEPLNEASDEEPETPEEGSEASDEAPEAPEAVSEASDEAPEAPEEGSEASDDAPEAPEAVSEASDEAPEAPEEGSEASDVALEALEAVSDASDVAPEAPDAVSEASNKTPEASDQAS